jgi:superfamily II DNA or RNA helicase
MQAVVLASYLCTDRLVKQLKQTRNFVSVIDDSKAVVDPRYAYVEYFLSSLLRPRQVELLDQFCDSIKQGKSGVSQLIMGQGKTQVISPALALLLADGTRSLTLITPRPLLRQSEDALNAFLCNPILNRSPIIFTFDRTSGKIPNHFESIKASVAEMSLPYPISIPR